MRIFFDTEFIEDGRTIDLVSIGLIRDDGCCYYAISNEFDPRKASQWVRDNVLAQLETEEDFYLPRARIANDIRKIVGPNPEFWAYYADYDWVVLCQLFGTMMDLPTGWPKYCLDVKQECVRLGNPRLPEQKEEKHNALADARWNKRAWEFLQELSH